MADRTFFLFLDCVILTCMTKKIIGILALLILIIGAGLIAFTEKNQSNNYSNYSSDLKDINTSTTTTKNISITMQEVSTHKDAFSCWSVINGSVYELTAWIGSHPGGQETILSICGKDGSSMFDGQHGESRRVLSILGKFKIGTIK